MFVLAHLSDPHLAPLPTATWRELASKRLLGFLNWRHTRVGIHRADVLEGIVRDLKDQSPTHIAVTGDLVNIALPDEFANAQTWLQRLGSPHDVTLVPGNHDAYVRSVQREPARFWGDYMRGDGEASSAGRAIEFPFVRRRGPVALIGVSTAVATAPLLATGWLGPAQIARLEDILARLGKEGLFRVLLIHHPPAGHRAAHKRLTDAEALTQVLKDCGVELVLHGHDHIASLNWVEGPRGRIPVVGVPSASANSAGHHVPAAYNLYRISEGSGGWACEVVSRGLRPGGTAVLELGRQTLVTNGLVNPA
jgi:3',5'-cyclic AMP phosphodiesterase CpdA